MVVLNGVEYDLLAEFVLPFFALNTFILGPAYEDF